VTSGTDKGRGTKYRNPRLDNIAAPHFRTIQVCPKDLLPGLREIELAAAFGDEETLEVDCGQFVPGRQRDDQIIMNERRPACRQDQTAIRPARECCDGALDLGRIVHVYRNYLYAERRRHRLD